ncbi:MAG: hypothetical protein AAF399_18110, partial [Bacteroidota bacterium]
KPSPPRRVGHEARGRGPDCGIGWGFDGFLPTFLPTKKLDWLSEAKSRLRDRRPQTWLSQAEGW